MAAEAPTDLELARAAFDALARGGVDAMLEYVHPEFEMETRPEIAAEPQVYSGHDGIRRYFESFYDAMDEVAIEPAALEELGAGRVYLQFRVLARGQASGIEVGMDARAVAVIRDDLLLRLEFLIPGEPAPGSQG